MVYFAKEMSWAPRGINTFEDAAWDAITTDKNCFVLAGPGAGKTELLAQRACYLLQTGVVRAPTRILAISFKRDAAKNLKDRVHERSDPVDAARFDSMTFDAFAKGLLDRFYRGLANAWRPTPDYSILLAKRETFSEFLTSIGLRAVENFERDVVLGSPLSVDGIHFEGPMAQAGETWWRNSLRENAQSNLTFPMIGRLVELLIRTNPLLRTALCATYPYVFMDEFQDTTHVQYDLMKSIFWESSSVVTAVGDNKQRIMGWAMALEDSFELFQRDFRARQIYLRHNFRSSQELTRIQGAIAASLDPESEPVESKSDSEVLGDACEILEFHSPEEEAMYLAEYLRSNIVAGELKPRDFVVLVKQRPDRYLKSLEAAFESTGLTIREENELQDVLSERLVEVLMCFLRLGSLQQGGQYWLDCMELTTRLKGLDPLDASSQVLLGENLQDLYKNLSNAMQSLPDARAELVTILNLVIGFIGEENIRILYPEYNPRHRYVEVLLQFVSYLWQTCRKNANWQSALDDLEGWYSIPIMTIHKSKGLQYHTVVFLALDDDAWWSFPREPEDGKSAFFVAFSRAKQRVVFTYCEARSKRIGVAPLYELLRDAGVHTRKLDRGEVCEE